MTDFDEQVPDESEQLDQLETDRTLLNQGDADPLDSGYSAPDHWSAAEGFGNTAEEMAEGESLDQKLAEERPEPDPYAPDEDRIEASTDPEVGDELADAPNDALPAAPGLESEEEGLDGDAGPDGEPLSVSDVNDLSSSDLGPDGDSR